MWRLWCKALGDKATSWNDAQPVEEVIFYG